MFFPANGGLPTIASKPGFSRSRVWWTLFIGNPLGYLPDDSDFERVEFELRPRRFFDSPADWMGGWEFSFFTIMIVVSLAIKFVFRLR